MDKVGDDRYRFAWHFSLTLGQLKSMGVVRKGKIYEEQVYERLCDYFDNEDAERKLMEYLGVEEDE